MPTCEDYPCCGHEAGDCPDSEGRFKCVICGRRMPIGQTSSICNYCRSNRRRMERFLEDDSRDYEY